MTREGYCVERTKVWPILCCRRSDNTQISPRVCRNFRIRRFSRVIENVCDAKDPINTLKDLSLIKGFGKWMLKQMKGYFDTETANSEQEDLPEHPAGKKTKERKRYIPQRNSVAYALLITLHRGTPNEKDFMRKQQLIDAADASGLSHAPVAPEKGKGKAGLGISKREWYSGWSCMTTLIQKGLVVKSSNPAKYMLTVEGREVAKECIMRSGLLNSHDDVSDDEMDFAQPFADPKSKADSAGPSRAQTCPVEILSDDEIDLVHPHASPKSKADSAGPSRARTCQVDLEESRAKKFRHDGFKLNPCPSSSSHAMKASSSSLASGGTEQITDVPRLPPLTFGEMF